jgi:nucleoside-diphosphate-sugar epimerase
MSFTVFGASGFIGSRLVKWLESKEYSCWAPRRDENVFGRPLGHAICCVGLTADFRRRQYDTVRAHVCYLLDILEKADFESFLYLSTTRIYSGATTSQEDVTLTVNPLQTNDLYNISKIMGESLCLASEQTNVRIARLSNVYGRYFSSESFLSSVIREAVKKNKLVLQTTLASEKDYVDINDVVRLLPQIALSGRHRIYNIASGVNTPNKAIVEVIQRVTGSSIEVAEGATTVVFPTICVNRIRDEFDFIPSLILDSLGDLVTEYQRSAEIL